MAEQLYLEYGSSFEILEDLVEQSEAFFRTEIDDEDLVYRLVLLTSEAVTNAIEHGNQLRPELKVRVWLEQSDARAEIVVEDEGGGFEPEGVGSPLSEDRILEDSGRGVFLMEELADKVLWEKGGRRVTLYVNLPHA